MEIGFNAQLLSYKHWYRSAGISRYIDRTLGALEPHARGDRFVAFVGPDVASDAKSLAWLQTLRTRLPTHRPLVRIAWEQLLLPLAIRQSRVKLLHSPAYVAPLAVGARSVVTFHDLSYFILPGAFNRSNRSYLKYFSLLSARRADRLNAVSESTRRDLGRFLGVSADRVDVVYNGVDDRFRKEEHEAVERFRQSHGLPARFVLYLGTLEPRKNVPGLIRAYARARKMGVTEPLVLAGGRGWGDLGLEQLIDELGIASMVRREGFASMEDQPLWYNAATLFAYPSLYEGFGLPVLEAMACGTPVVASNRSSLPEVLGDTGMLCDPDDDDALGQAIYMLLHDDDLRTDLSERGRIRAKSFTWDAAATATMETYRKTLGLT